MALLNICQRKSYVHACTQILRVEKWSARILYQIYCKADWQYQMPNSRSLYTVVITLGAISSAGSRLPCHVYMVTYISVSSR